MPSDTNEKVSIAAGIAAIGVDLLTHPLDTLITRLQSPTYRTTYKHPNGQTNPILYRGLYQGFGPTVLTSIPASIAFFTIYETLKPVLAGNTDSQPRQIAAYALSSAVAELVACAITNPAEVLKQNAQVVLGGSRSPLATTVGYFMRRPAALWAGYMALVAGHLPGTSLTFAVYEYLKTGWVRDGGYVWGCLFSGAVAGAAVSVLFVPVDVVKTRMRLAAGDGVRVPSKIGVQAMPRRSGAVAVAKGILRKEGIRGLFRGGGLTCVAAGLRNGLFLGGYEGLKVYFRSVDMPEIL